MPWEPSLATEQRTVLAHPETPAGNRYITRHYMRHLATVTFGDESTGITEVSADIYALLREGDQITVTHPTSHIYLTLFVGTAYNP